MRNRWLGYIAALLLATAIVTASVFVPSALLRRQEAALLGDVTYKSYGNYPRRTAARPAVTPAPTPAASPAAGAPVDEKTAQIRRDLLIMENSAGSADINEPSASDINMKTAIIECSDQINIFIKANAIPPLPNFPDEYTISATLHTAYTPQGDFFDFWSVSFSTNTKLAKAHSGISMIVDAKTGAIYSIKMYTSSGASSFGMTDAAAYIANALGVKGSLQPQPDNTGENASTLWVSSDRSLFITFYYRSGDGGASFAMNISTKPPT